MGSLWGVGPSELHPTEAHKTINASSMRERLAQLDISRSSWRLSFDPTKLGRV
jgi:hypothetical protein